MTQLEDKDKKKLQQMFDRGRKAVGELDIKRASVRAGRMITRLEEKGIPESLKVIWKDIVDLYSLTSDSLTGKYRIPLKSMAAIIFTLLYFANPFDIIPDLIPLAGYIDDAFIISLCLKFIETDLEKYRVWKYPADSIEPQSGRKE